MSGKISFRANAARSLPWPFPPPHEPVSQKAAGVDVAGAIAGMAAEDRKMGRQQATSIMNQELVRLQRLQTSQGFDGQRDHTIKVLRRLMKRVEKIK